MARVLLAKPRRITAFSGALGPPMGLMYIASVLREAGHEVLIFESGLKERDFAPFRAMLRAFRPRVVGLSATTFEARPMASMARITKEERPEATVVVGGPHATVLPERCLDHPAIDFAVIGEGERTALELVNALDGGGKALAEVNGLACRDGAGNVVRTPPRAPIADLDSIPFPAWDLIDVGFYAKIRGLSPVGSRRYMPIVSSRGCPFRCIFCYRHLGKTFRARSAEHVTGEMAEIARRYGVHEFDILDDTFNLDRDRALEILERLATKRRNTRLNFACGLRSDLVDAELAIRLARAGTNYVGVAVESAVPRIQALIKKNLDLENVTETIRLLVENNMYVGGHFMLGFPTETLEEARQTVDFAVRSRLHHAFFPKVTPLPGTPLFDLVEAQVLASGTAPGLEDVDFHTGFGNASAIPDKELDQLLREAHRRFYLDPSRLARILLRHPRPLQLIAYGGLTAARILSG